MIATITSTWEWFTNTAPVKRSVSGAKFFGRVLLPFTAGTIRPLITAMIVAWASRELFFNLYQLFGLNIDLEINCPQNTTMTPIFPNSTNTDLYGETANPTDCTLALLNWKTSEVISTLLFPMAALSILMPSRLGAITGDYYKNKLQDFKRNINYQSSTPPPTHSGLDIAAFWATAATCMLGAATGAVSTLLNKISDTRHDTSTNIFEVFPLYISLSVGAFAALMAYFPFKSFVGGTNERNILLRQILRDNGLTSLDAKLGYHGMRANFWNWKKWDINAMISTECNYLFPAMHSIQALLSLFTPTSAAKYISSILSTLAIVSGHRISVYGRVTLQQIKNVPELTRLADGIKTLQAMDNMVVEALYELKKAGVDSENLQEIKKQLENKMKKTAKTFINSFVDEQKSETKKPDNLSEPKSFDFVGEFNSCNDDSNKTFLETVFYNQIDEQAIKSSLEAKLAKISKGNKQKTEEKLTEKTTYSHMFFSAFFTLLFITDGAQFFLNNAQAVMAVLSIPFISLESQHPEDFHHLQQVLFGVGLSSAGLALPYFYIYSLKPAWTALHRVRKTIAGKLGHCCQENSKENQPLLPQYLKRKNYGSGNINSPSTTFKKPTKMSSVVIGSGNILKLTG